MFVKAGTAEGDVHQVYLNGQRIEFAIEADTDKGYVIEKNQDKGTYDPRYSCRIRRLTGKVELVHTYTGVVTT